MKAIDDFFGRNGISLRGGKVLCAVSGGADSVCLLALMREESAAGEFSVACAHFNHRLRGDESDRDEAFVRALCEKWGVEFYCGSGDVAGYARENGMGTEEAARVLRYDFLQKTAESAGCAVIATAHTANDNAETVIMNLARGGGSRGLSGIPPVRGNIIRPMLEMTRDDVTEYLRENSLGYVEDSTNASDDYARNRVRHHIIPLLLELNSAATRNISRAARLLREDDEFLDGQARKFIAERGEKNSLPAQELAALPVPIASRVIRHMCARSVSEGQVSSVLELCGENMSGRSVDVTGARVTREFDRLLFSPEAAQSIEKTEIYAGMPPILAGDYEICCERLQNCIEVHSSLTTFFFKYENIYGKMFVRSRQPGDEIRLIGRGCTKSLKKLFAEKRLPLSERDGVPVIADEKGVIAVFGFGVAERCRAEEGSEVIKIEVKERKNYE
jgi:tRNA(Ile)-lysidine synthase